MIDLTCVVHVFKIVQTLIKFDLDPQGQIVRLYIAAKCLGPLTSCYVIAKLFQSDYGYFIIYCN